MGKCSIKEAFIKIESDGQVYVFGMHISHMRREISLTKIRCVCGNFFSTNWRSAADVKDQRKRIYAGAAAGVF